MSRTRTAVILCLALAIVGTGGLHAQVTGEIEGTVTDEGGGALPGVTVTATNEDTGLSRTAITNAEGNYDIKAISSGSYTVSGSLITGVTVSALFGSILGLVEVFWFGRRSKRRRFGRVRTDVGDVLAAEDRRQ